MTDTETKGKWLDDNNRPMSERFICSKCNDIAYYPQFHKKTGTIRKCLYVFCPNCGKPMEVRDDASVD